MDIRKGNSKLILFFLLFQIFTPLFVKADFAFYTLKSGGETTKKKCFQIDNNGFPHVCYTEFSDLQELKYKKWTGTEWVEEIIDAKFVIDFSIVIDSNNYTHIAYTYSAPDNFSCGLNYMVEKSTYWYIQNLLPQECHIGAIDISLDKQNSPGIIYVSSINVLEYLRWDGTTWYKNTICKESNAIENVKLLFDINNNPHVAYGSNSFNGQGIIKYAKWNGIEWSTHTIESLDRNFYSVDLASMKLDPINSRLHIFYGVFCMGNEENNKLKLAILIESGDWFIETFDFPYSYLFSADIDKNGYIHVAYAWYDWSREDVRYAKYKDGSWMREIIENIVDVSGEVELYCDKNNIPHLCYERDPSLLRYSFWIQNNIKDFKGKAISSKEIMWSWSNTISGVLNYQLKTSTGGIIATLSPETNFYIEKNLIPGNSYKRYIYCNFGPGGSISNADIVFTCDSSYDNIEPDKIIVYPNPINFLDLKEVKFAKLPVDSEVEIFDIKGRLIKKIKSDLVYGSETSEAKWDGRNENGNEVAPGIYIYIVKNSGGYVTAGKVGVIR